MEKPLQTKSQEEGKEGVRRDREIAVFCARWTIVYKQTLELGFALDTSLMYPTKSMKDPVVSYSLACRSRHLQGSVSLLAYPSRQVILSPFTRERFARNVSHSLKESLPASKRFKGYGRFAQTSICLRMFHLDLSRFSKTKHSKLLYNTVKMLIKVILVQLGFHMCSPCLYTCSLFQA